MAFSLHTLYLVTAVLTCSMLPGMCQPNAIAMAQTGSNALNSSNCVLLLVDHQTGLFQLVRDYDVDEFKTNVLALAATAKAFNVPTILTTSAETGPNGPLLPEIRQMFPDAPYIPRPGQINAWDNTDFVNAVKATGRKKILIAGIVTDVCVVFPALSALAEGYEVYMVVDAAGTFNTAVRDAALARAQAAGAIPINWFAVACELQRDWRQNGDRLLGVLKEYLPEYGNLVTSHNVTAAAPAGAPAAGRRLLSVGTV